MKDQCINCAKKLGQKEEALRLRELYQEEYILPARWTRVAVVVVLVLMLYCAFHRGECQLPV